MSHEVKISDDVITVNGKETIFNSWKNADESDWTSLNTDIVILATGKPQNLDEAQNHISKGAKKVFIASTPVDFSNIPLLVSGCNDESISLESDIISSVSYTHLTLPTILSV